MNAIHRPLRRLQTSLAIGLLVIVASGHVGTLDVFFRGFAGPYRIQVTIRPPGVIPGLAQILVRTEDPAITRVTTQAALWSLGSRGAPTPDDARRSPGDAALWTSELWLMTSGSYAIAVAVTGPSGAGQVTIPFSSVATRQLPMSQSLGLVMAGLGLFLVAGLVSIIGTAARESIVAPGVPVDAQHRRRGRLAMLGGVLVLALGLTGGRSWWNAVDAAYARNLFRPMAADLRLIEDGAAAPRLRLVITDSAYATGRRTPIIPDHGKPVHLFLVREGDLGALGHSHPVQLDSMTFEGRLAGLPAGDYRYYADVVHESGFAQTLTGRITLPSSTGASSSDIDDAASARGPTDEASVSLPGNLVVSFSRPAGLASGQETQLHFVIRDSSGAIVTVEPYLGMPGHAIVSRDDGEVFAHLHGNGSFSMAAQDALLAVQRGDTLPSSSRTPRPRLAGEHLAHTPTAPGDLSFPFAFPSPGRYVVWLQFRHDSVRTAAFSLSVR